MKRFEKVFRLSVAVVIVFKLILSGGNADIISFWFFGLFSVALIFESINSADK